MRSKIILVILAIAVTISGYGKTWKVTNNYYAFNPASITINRGDTVIFEISLGHDVREVSQTTWNCNGNTALEGGFQLPFGGGTLLPEKLSVGTHYYVCTAYAAIGMKDIFTVQDVASGIDNPIIANLSVYPNPARDFSQVKSDGILPGSDLVITDVYGRRVREGRLDSGSSSVDVNCLSPGVYFIQVGRNTNQEFIKE